MRSTNREILRLAIPSIVSNLTVPLLGLVDVAIMGHIDNVAYIGAIAVGSMIFNVSYWLFGFLRMGTSGMTAQALGARDMRTAMLTLTRAQVIAIGVAVMMIMLQLPLLRLALWAISPSAEVAPHVMRYFQICVWGAPATLMVYVLSGWFIGMQNTRFPMIVAISQNIINIVASAVFVFAMGMKIEGAALGTLTAQWAGFAIAVMMWYGGYRQLWRYRPTNIKTLRNGLRRFFNVNSDIFLRTVFLVAVNLFFTSAGARQGDMILAVNTLLMTLFMLFSYVMDGFAFAGEALGGKYYGMAQHNARIEEPHPCPVPEKGGELYQPIIQDGGDGLREVTRMLFIWGIALVVIFTATYAIGGRHILSLLTSHADVVEAAMPYLPWAIAVPVCGMAAFIYDGLFIGITATRGMLIACAIAAIIFFAVFLTLYPTLANHALWLAFCLFLIIRGVTQHIIFKKLSFMFFVLCFMLISFGS